MKVRRAGLATVGAALSLAALVAVIGAAQAAPSGKSYTANVRLTAAGGSHFTLALKNDLKSKQPLGSANFTAPVGFSVPSSSQSITQGGNTWTVASDGSRVVTFRPSTSDDALLPNESLSASVNVTVPGSCSSALWQVQAKQSNDFSGQPGNDFLVNSATSDLIPLGSFAIAPIQTVKDEQTIPAILTEVPHPSSTTAKDTCGNTKTNYTGAVRTQTFLTQATFSPTSGLNWTNGIGTLSITPEWTETGNELKVTDPTTGISDTSDPFDTTDKLCTPSETSCQWEDEGKKILAETDPPLPGANIGIGFNSLLPFECAGGNEPIGDSIVNINPRGYTAPYTVSLTYDKSATGNGPASSFDVCLSKDNGDTWDTALSECPSSPEEACILERKRVTGGDLLVVLFLFPGDPWGGLS
jgi:hypothetical protein